VAFACAGAVAHVGPLGDGVARVRLGGGLSGSSVWAQTLAAVHDLPVERVVGDASPLGAAMLAGMGLGVWADEREAALVCVGVRPVEVPEREAVRSCRAARQRYEAAVQALAEMGRRTGAEPRVPAPEDDRPAVAEVGA
jgi:sugar (pentulose or hexulose) kinase